MVARIITVIAIFVVFYLSHARILVYDTETNNRTEYFDCIYYVNDSSTIKYCRRIEEIISIARHQRKDCVNDGVKWLFSELLGQNITPDEVLSWSSSIVAADNYAAIFYNSVLNANIDDFVCNCTKEGTFGRYCEYELFHEAISFEQALDIQFTHKKIDFWGNQEWGDIICYNTLSCNFGMRCLEWRNICDGEQQCMDGNDEENCDILEFNECEEDEYRCINGMCIAEEYWIDGDADCMDTSDERLDSWGSTCPFEPRSIDCDEHLCFRDQNSCGDGQCIQPKDSFVFQTRLPFDWHCLSLREFNYMCEMNMRWPLWTKVNGLCTRTMKYNDPSLSINNDSLSNDEKCVYLIRCALSHGLEHDCPCDHTNCTEIMARECITTESYAYPTKGVIRPFIKTYYDWHREDWLSHTPNYIIAEGSLKCRGFHGIVNGSKLNYTTFLIDRMMIDFRVCYEISIHRNITSSIKYDETCWNNSRTFNNRSYAYYNICSISRECISQYRIRDGYQQCGDGGDEEEEEEIKEDLCINIRKHRLQCSSDQYTCLFIYKLGNSYDDCNNKYDELFYGTGSPITEITCNKKHDIGCSILRDYINNLSNTLPSNNITLAVRKHKRIPFRTYCNSFWNTDSHMDEWSQYCQYWTCRSDQYRCATGQCIDLDWVCDGEWDCADASDEEALIFRNEQSLHSHTIHNIKNQTNKCYQRYVNQSFSNICNIFTEFPCYVINVTDPLNIKANRPCIKLNQLGDGIEHCYGGLDEKNTLVTCNGLMRGFTYQCERNPCIRYSYACVNDSDDCMDKVLCAYQSVNKTWCSGYKDVVCLNGICQKGARCNRIIECTYGEDEFWCSSNVDYYGQRFYRWKKEVSLEHLQFLYLPTYPSSMSQKSLDKNIAAKSTCSQSIKEISRNLSRVDTYNNHSYICNRGIAISMGNEKTVCFCPPAYYGMKCQYHSDRLTIITHIEWKNFPLQIYSTSSSIFKVIVTLVYIDRVIDHHIFHVNPAIESHKERFYLLYSRFNKMMEHKQKRYFNRTDILLHHPYSVRFDLYNISNNEIYEYGSWHRTIFFDFLPSFRLATVLKFPVWLNNAADNPCLNKTCSLNSSCQPVLNQKNSYYCSCNSGFYGPTCEKYEVRCLTYCSSHSICKISHQDILTDSNHLLCICPLNRYGPRCNLLHNECNSSPCAHNATCQLTYDPSGQRPFICSCSKQFYGDRCQFEKLAIRIDINISVSALASVVQFYDVHNSSLALLIQHQKVHFGLPPTIYFDHGRTQAPIFSMLKIYDRAKISKLFVLYIQPNASYINITSTPVHCVHSSSLLFNDNISVPAVFKYHRLCNNTELLCFFDDNYLCICQDDHKRVDCFGHSLTLDQCSSCLSDGKCIRGDPNDVKDFICLCSRCHHGRLCEFRVDALGFTIDSLLATDNFTIQLIYVCFAILLFFIGLLNNLSSFVTFKRIQSRKCNVGNYLLIVSVLNQCALFCLLLKFIYILVGSSYNEANIPFIHLISCKILSYFLSVFTRTVYWLTSWVTLDRLYVTLFPMSVLSRNSQNSIRTSGITLIILAIIHVHEVLYYTVVQDQSGSSSCVIKFENSIVANYSRVNTLFNYLGPFILQTVAITLLIMLATHSRAKTTSSNITFRDMFKKQFATQRELYLTPIVIIISALPQLVSSFSLACTQLHIWQRHTLLITYLLSYAPQILGFILFVLPSSKFKKEFDETSIGKRFSQMLGLSSQ